MTFFLSFFLFLSSSKASLENVSLKRSFTRRLITKEQAQKNPIFQTLNPILLPKSEVLQGSSFGGLYLINRFGRKKLIYRAPEGLSGSLSVGGDFAFIGLQNKSALAINYKNKELLWKIQLDSAPTALSEIKDGLIFIQTELGSLYSISAGDGVINWKAQYQGSKDLNIYGDPRPILIGQDIIAGFESGHVVKLKRKTGQVIWERKLPGGRKYSDVQYLRLDRSGRYVMAGVFDEAVYRLDLITGLIQWKAFDKPVSDFGFDEEHIYFSSADGEMIKLKQTTGTVIKKSKVFEGVGGSPLVLDGSIIVIDSKGPVFQIDRNSFENRPLYEFFHNVSSEITYDRNHDALYVLTNKGYFFRMKVLKR